jgi:hypothetical protein
MKSGFIRVHSWLDLTLNEVSEYKPSTMFRTDRGHHAYWHHHHTGGGLAIV